jgi:hypothetical protein
MINHARTLLMNIAPDPIFDQDSLGDEIIAPTYTQLTLPSRIQRVRELLFGSAPDREMLNYRCFQFLRLIHSTDLQQYITDLDERITYSFDADPFLDRDVFTPVSVQVAGDTKQFVITGPPLPPDERGSLKQILHVGVGSSVPSDVTVTPATGLVTIPLPNTGGLNSAMIQSPADGDLWRVTWRSRPTRDLGELLAALKTIGGETLIDLFNRTNAQGQTEPWITFRNLFEDHYDLPHQLGGALLALIYRSEEVRTS